MTKSATEPIPEIIHDLATFTDALEVVFDAEDKSRLDQGVHACVAALSHQLRDELEDPGELLSEEIRQIAEAKTLERGRYYLRRLIRGLTETRTSAINDINLNRWKAYGDLVTDSLWVEPRRARSGAHAGDYWGNFIPQIPNQFMRRYTKADEWVLDPFCGSGTTLIECRRLGRHGLGLDLQPDVAEAAEARVASEPNPHSVHTPIHVGDAKTAAYGSLLEPYGISEVQLVIMHPPYHDIIQFSEDDRDLSNAPDVAAFLDSLEQVASAAIEVLEDGRFAILVIGDLYRDSSWEPLGFRAMQRLLEADLGLVLKSIVVKNFDTTAGKRSQEALWRYRALAGGFFVFKHEYIFLFQKGA